MQDIAAHSVGDVLDVDGEQFRVSRAKRADVPAILDLLGEEMPSTEVRDRLHAAITRDRSHYLAVVRDASGAVVGTMELTFVPGFSQGGTRASRSPASARSPPTSERRCSGGSTSRGSTAARTSPR